MTTHTTKETFEKSINKSDVADKIKSIATQTEREVKLIIANRPDGHHVHSIYKTIADRRYTDYGICPSGDISFEIGDKKWEIPVDSIFKRFPELKNNYDKISSEKNKTDIATADFKLVSCILVVLDDIKENGENGENGGNGENKDKIKDGSSKEKEGKKKENINKPLATFTDAYPEEFMEYCKSHNITREDKKPIDGRRGLDPYAIFVSEDGRKFKLIPQPGANISDELGIYEDYSVATSYKFVVIENSKDDSKRDNNKQNVTENNNVIENKIAFNEYFEEHKKEIIGIIMWIDGIKYKATHINRDGALQFKQVDGKDHFVIKSFRELKYKGQVNGFDDGLLTDGSPRKGSEKLTKTERERHRLIWLLILGESEYLKNSNNKNSKNHENKIVDKNDESLNNSNNNGKETGNRIVVDNNGNDDFDKINPDELVGLEATISEVTESYLDEFSNQAANELKEEWSKLKKGNRFKRNLNPKKAWLWLTRGRKQKKREEKLRQEYLERSRFVFTEDDSLNEKLSKQVSRHDYEERLGKKEIPGGFLDRQAFGEIKRENLIDSESNSEIEEEFKQMCQEYIVGGNKEKFQEEFNDFVQNRLNLPKGEEFLATNILDKLDAIREDNQLLDLIIKDLMGYLNDRNGSHFDSIKKIMDVYFENYRRDPRFRSKVIELLGTSREPVVLYTFTDSAKGYDFAKYCEKNGVTRFDGKLIDGSKGVDTDAIYKSKDGKRLRIVPKKGADNSIKNVGEFGEHGGVTEYELVYDVLDEKIEKFIKHQKALAKMSANNLKVKLDLLTNGKGAYQVNNEDHKKGRLFKASKAFDEMPWGWQVASISVASILAGTGVAFAGGSAVVATAASAAAIGGANFFKKIKHYTDEQKKVEGNIARDSGVAGTIRGSKKRYEDGLEFRNGPKGWRERYKARKHRKKYGETTHSYLLDKDSGNTKDISDMVYSKLNRYDELPEFEKNKLNCVLLDSVARLQTYRTTGHNFLKSRNRDEIEKDFYDLENSLDLCAKRIYGKDATIEDLTMLPARDDEGNETSYQDLLNYYNEDYEAASKKFNTERRRLAARWGLKTAVISFAISAGLQAVFKTGMFAENKVKEVSQVVNQYELGQHTLNNGSKTLDAAKDHISNLGSSDKVTFKFGGGTNDVPLSPSSPLHNPHLFTTKLDSVIDVVKHSHLSNANDIVDYLDSIRNVGFNSNGQTFLSPNLQRMRCLQEIQDAVTGAGDFSGQLNLVYDTALNTTTDKISTSQFIIEYASGLRKVIIPGVWVSNEFENPPQGTDEIQDSSEQDPLQQDPLQQDPGENLPWYKRNRNSSEDQIGILGDDDEIVDQQLRRAA